MAERFPDRQTMGRSAERQMRQWAISLQVEEQRRRERIEEFQPAVHPYLAISREAGAYGSRVAALVGKRLGWQVLDRQLLNYMADHYKLANDMLEFVDETTSNWLIEILGKWLSRQVVTQTEYVMHVGRIALLAAHHASTVFVGRGIQFLLPSEKGLTVRIIAPRELRIQRMVEQKAISPQDAAKDIDERDRGRREFLKRYFHCDVDDPHLYDITINTERLDENQAVELILHLIQLRFPC
ncbi:MAG: cytidylate kinase-like family protein [Pirellulales bacterium]|nr:cytidylate kinase-like family protein [Pirellulales bacterium]